MYLPLGDVTNSTNLGYGCGRKRLRVESSLAPLFEEEIVFTTCVVTQLFFSVPHHWLIIQQTSGLQCIFQINIGLPHCTNSIIFFNTIEILEQNDAS